MPTAGWLRRVDLPLDAKGRSYIDPANLDQILDQFVNWRGNVNGGGYTLSNVSLAANVTGLQTPWQTNIDAAGHSLSNIAAITGTGPVQVNGAVQAKGQMRLMGGLSLSVHPVFDFFLDGVNRWEIGVNYTSLSFAINRYNGSGGYVETVISAGGTNGRLTLGGTTNGGVLFQPAYIPPAEVPNGQCYFYISEAAGDQAIYWTAKFSTGVVKQGKIVLA